MEKRVLNDAEIAELYRFSERNHVIYYDLQIEFVDHLASAIEAQWAQNSEQTFEQALQRVSDDFGGLGGFIRIKDSMKVMLRKKYRKLLWGYVLEYYRFPKIVLTVLASVAVFLVLDYLPNDKLLVLPLLVSVIGFAAFYLLYYYPKHLKINLPAGKRLWLVDIAQSTLVQLPIYTMSFSVTFARQDFDFAPFWAAVFSVVYSFLLILLWGDCFYVPQKIREHFENQFPQFIKA